MPRTRNRHTETHAVGNGSEAGDIYPQRRDFWTHRHHEGGVIFPLLILFAGVTLLGNNFGLIPWGIWQSLIQFWPVLLILGGISILLGDNSGSRLVMSVIGIVVIVSVWTKALIDVGSSLVFSLGLDKLPWFSLLQSTPVSHTL
jgi:hypothetical protein